MGQNQAVVLSIHGVVVANMVTATQPLKADTKEVNPCLYLLLFL